MKFFLAAVALSFCAIGRAQDFSIEATVNTKSLYMNQSLQLTVTLKNTTGKITLPKFQDWQVISGPSSSTNMSIYNGKMTSSYSETFGLRPLKEGTLIIPEITAKTDKGTLASKPVTVTVQKGNAPAAPSNTKPNAQQTPAQATGDFFIEVQLSKSKVYQGESVLATYSFYSTANPQQIEKIEYPKLDGFWSEEIETQPQVQTSVINGRRYYTATVKRQLLFPQVSGTLKIDGFSMGMIVSNGQNFFNRQNFRVEDVANNVKLEVLPLPPGNSGNNLGSYSPLEMKVETEPTKLKANEAINLKVTFNGKGNLKLIEKPEFEFPSDFEVFDPKTKDNITINTGGESGSRSFEYVLIPRTAGEYTIPEFSKSYFDYGTKSWQKLSSPELNFSVSPSDGSASGNYTFDNRTDVQVLSQDIRFIKTGKKDLVTKSNLFFGSVPFYGMMAFPFLLLGIVVLVRRKKDEEETDVVGTAMKRAGKVARKHLSVARAELNKGNSTNFHHELFKSVNNYLSQKLAIPLADLNRQRIRSEFEKRFSATDVESLSQIIERCEMAHFGGVTVLSDNELMQQAESLIAKLEGGK